MVVTSLDGFGSLLSTKLSAKDIYSFKDKLLKNLGAKTINELYFLVESLITLNKSKIRIPYHFSELTVEGTKLKFSVSDLFGKNAEATVKIEKVYSSEDTIVEDVEMKNTPSTNDYFYDFTDEKDSFQSGVLNVKLVINPIKISSSSRELKINKVLRFETDCHVKNFILTVNDKKGIVSSQSVQYPNKLSPFESVSHDKVVGISFSLLNSKGINVYPQQVFVRFSLDDNEVTSFIPKSNNFYKLDLVRRKIKKNRN
jgi:hypothetical protein